MGCKIIDDHGDHAVEFADVCGDVFRVRNCSGDLEIDWDRDPTGKCFSIRGGDVKVLARLAAIHAEDGDLSRAKEAIAGDEPADGRLAAMQDWIDEVEQRVSDIEEKFVACQIVTRLKAVEEKVSAFSGQLGDVREWLRKLQGAFDARGDRIDAHWRLIQRAKERLDALEERTKPQATAPEPPRTPQEIADEMSERFPVGTKVLYSYDPKSPPLFPGLIDSRFAAIADGTAVVRIRFDDETCFSSNVEPAE